MTGNQYIDWESGKCSFNSESFISLLEFVKEFPEQLPDDYYDNVLRGELNSWFREEKVLLDRTSLYSFSAYNYTKRHFWRRYYDDWLSFRGGKRFFHKRGIRTCHVLQIEK